ncbi:MAG: CDP-alcohol phosphatidyltransferase family protein [Pedosphaera sp.]|nr:CDP-alcohol phosphatidyltransferase family protein [Pedosphaera sp.]
MPADSPPLPALIVCDGRVGSLQLAALTLLDRLVVALHRAGCAPIRVVCNGERPILKRATALGVVPEFIDRLVPIDRLTLLADCSLLVQPADVKAVIEQKARLATASGRLLPLGIVSEFTGDVVHSLASLPTIRATGVTVAVEDTASARAAAGQLWASLGNSTDGFVDTFFNRPVGRFLSKVLVHTPVTPNQITLISMILGLVAAWFFSRGEHLAGILGAVLLQLSALIDCVDGEVARVSFKESPIGRTLDFACDQVVHLAVFGALALALSHQNPDGPALALGLSAVCGTLISIPIVIRGRCVAERASDRRLDRFIDQASTRDFTALVIFLAIVDRLSWFLWLTGVTVHVFWIIALALQLPGRQSRPAKSVNT